MAYPVFLEQAFDDGRAAHLLGIAVYVVPHHELVEREQTEHCLLHHIPAWLAGQLSAHGGEYCPHVDTTLVLGQRLQSLQVNLVLLAQHLHQRGVDGHLFIAAAHHIVITAAAHQLHGHEQQRGIARAHTLLVLIPAHQAKHHVERVGTVLFQCRSRLAVEELLRARHLVCREIGVQAVVLDVLRHQLLQLVLVEARVVDAELVGLQQLLHRHGLHAIVFAVEDMVFEHVDIERHKRNDTPTRAEVQQVVAQREVQELALPNLLAGDLCALLQLQLGRLHLLQSRGGLLVFQSCILPHAVHLHRQRPDAFHSAAIHIAEQHELVLLGNKVFLTHLHRLLKRDGIRAGQCRGLEEHHLADAVGSGLREERPVVAHAIGGILVHEPAAHKHMSLLQHEQRMQATRLQHRCHEQRQVHAGAELLVEHTVYKSHALTRLLVAGWRCSVDESLAPQRLVDGCHLRTGAVRVLRLVFVEGSAAGELLKNRGGVHLHLRQLRGIRRDEGGEHLRPHTHARPFVEGQQAQGEALLCIAHGQRERRLHALRHLAQLVEVGLHVEIGHAHRHPCRHGVDDVRGVGNQVAAHLHLHTMPVVGSGIADFYKFQTLLAVHGHCIIQTRQELRLHILHVYHILAVHTVLQFVLLESKGLCLGS